MAERHRARWRSRSRVPSPRPFAAAARDGLRSGLSVPSDLRAHPVIQLLLRRRDEGSRPGRRSDGRHVALVIEGGGMRGVVSAGMGSALEQLGLRECFDAVHGASAGALNAAFLLAGQAAYGCALYRHGFGDPRFVSLGRGLRGGPAIDMDYVVNEVWRRQRPLRIEAILQGGIALHCTATDVDRAQIVDLAQFDGEAEVRMALLASSRLPWLAGPPVNFRGRRLLDATLAEGIPVHVAQHESSDILVLQTRPQGVIHSPPATAVARLTERYLASLNPALVTLHRTRSRRYDLLSEQLELQTAAPDASPRVCVIRPPAGAVVIGHLEQRGAVLHGGAHEGLRAGWAAFTGEEPEVLVTLQAYPAFPKEADAPPGAASRLGGPGPTSGA